VLRAVGHSSVVGGGSGSGGAINGEFVGRRGHCFETLRRVKRRRGRQLFNESGRRGDKIRGEEEETEEKWLVFLKWSDFSCALIGQRKIR